MRRKIGVALAGIALAALAAAAVSIAGEIIQCTGGPCNGTQVSDNILGTDERDVIDAKGGGDEVLAFEGDDKIKAAGGPDEASGDAGKDTILGGPGVDRLEGGTQADVIRGGSGDDRELVAKRRRGTPVPGFFTNMFGDAGNDKIYGDDGKDFMEGEEGADKLYGGSGPDFLDAVNDDDDKVDRLNCGKGKDRYRAAEEDIVFGNCETEIDFKD